MKKVIKVCFGIFFVGVLLFIGFNFIGYAYAFFAPKIDIRSANAFYLYDSKENLILQGNEHRDWITLDKMNPLVIDATISVEDKNFYSHNGFDFLRIAKALFLNVLNGEIVQGASTITQQYAKNLFLDFGQSWERKWKEMWLTFRLEGNYSKDEILEGYLNTINYGHGVYGIGKAANYYFNKDVSELSLAEISILVGIPNSPSNYSPIDNYELAKERQNVVLTRMVDNGYISREEKESAINTELKIYGKMENYDLSSLLYYQDAVMNELESINEIPKSYLETGGLKIYTALDIEAQSALEAGALENEINDEVQTAKVMMNSNDGSIIGLIGGINYGNSQFNRAISSLRQPGSTVKPFLYYKALENGLTASTVFESSPVTFNFESGGTYTPKNSGSIYGNKDITMALAMAYSDNIYAVKTHLFLGDGQLYDILREVGITTDMADTPSLPLGSYEVKITELAAAYASLSNMGHKVTPHLIEKVFDMKGNLIYEFKNREEVILDSDLVFIINELLTGSYDSNLIDYTYPTCIGIVSDLTNKYALKSGSTDTDAWVVGFNKDIVLVSWSGYDDSRDIETKVVTNNKKSWAIAMEKYLKGKESGWYSMPENVSGVLVNPVNGKIATNSSKNKKILYYVKNTEPTLYDDAK